MTGQELTETTESASRPREHGTETIRIIIVDDHPVVCRGLTAALA